MRIMVGQTFPLPTPASRFSSQHSALRSQLFKIVRAIVRLPGLSLPGS